ncbi:methionyl-tRNA formyltransferase [Pseudovibrio ascidiaceicola]|uniref:Methionyl-tRNA formyltransferase n=1 Tax=Pseudovibrio ascidiaceicola TaxID=285279 RepID=A0A1I4G776_9HYPH|nr:formyltransferase family protein [Pseudovibrio ascidiaceicola]SFL25360.1 methionyl-tRNA formyltransferase [Pseudovibrio ascidiaceicola]
MLAIHLLCNNLEHPIIPHLQHWIKSNQCRHQVSLISSKEEAKGGDILLLISCSDYISSKITSKYSKIFVIHASDLPKGRGWSPHVWTLLDGAEELTISLIEAHEKIDQGDIWAQEKIAIAPSDLFDEIDSKLFAAEIRLIEKAVRLIESGQKVGTRQIGEASYFPKRTPEDSEIDPSKPLSDTFNKIRLMDVNRYPAFFKLHDSEFIIEIKKRV